MPLDLVLAVAGTVFVVVLILLFERRRARGIEQDLRDQARGARGERRRDDGHDGSPQG